MLSALLLAAATQMASAPAAGVPLRRGLTIVTAIASGAGDYESIKRVDARTASDVIVHYSAPNVANPSDHILGTRTIHLTDLAGARWYDTDFSRGPKTRDGTTALGTSRAVLNDLRTTGRATMRWSHGGEGDMTATLQRVEARDVPVAVIVDDRRTMLPAIHATGSFTVYGPLRERGDFYFLDDPDDPIALKWRVGKNALTVVKIVRGTDGSESIERALAKNRRATVYGIYFDTGSAAIRPESRPAIEAVARSLRTNPGWKLNVEGHTDDVGGAPFNLELSRRRALAVKDALVAQFGIAPQRLSTTGYGMTRPKDTNATIEGRARNRRVELSRV